MGRPKKTEGEYRLLDVRLTPPTNDDHIVFNPSAEDFKVFIACREYGKKSGKLHYHIYCETLRSDTWLANYWYEISFQPKGSGNKAFKQKKAHEGTIGYVVKDGDVQCRHGWDQTFLEEWLEKSKQYRRDLEANKKKKQRDLNRDLASIFREVVDQATLDTEFLSPSQYAESLIALVLHRYSELDLRFPPRSTLDNAICKHMYGINEHYTNYITRLYSRSFNSMFI